MPTVEELKEQAAGNKPACIILAKGHSKRLPHKNKLVINGKPLVQYAMETALKSDLFGFILTSSDDEDILEIGYEVRMGVQDKGCFTLHKRPKTLCDQVQMRHVIRYLMGIYKIPDVFCVLTPCNPLRTIEDLQEGYKLFKEKDANYVMSVKKIPSPEYAIYLDKKGVVKPRQNILQTQKYPQAYMHDGNFIFAKRDIFTVEFEWGFYGSKNYPYITKHPTVDIDTEEDFEYCKYLMEKTELDNV